MEGCRVRAGTSYQSLVVEDSLHDVRDTQLSQVGICLCKMITNDQASVARAKKQGSRTCPHPTKMMGCPVTYVMDSAAPTCNDPSQTTGGPGQHAIPTH